MHPIARGLAAIESCVRADQVPVAHKYMKLALARYADKWPARKLNLFARLGRAKARAARRRLLHPTTTAEVAA